MEQITNLSEGFNELVLKFYPILEAASKRGIPIDVQERDKLIVELESERDILYKEIQNSVSDEIRGIHPTNGYVRVPQEVNDLIQVYKEKIGVIIPQPGKRLVSLDEFIAKKTYHRMVRAGEELKIWAKFRFGTFEILDKEGNVRVEKRWCLVKDFNPNASTQIIRYMKSQGHKVPVKLDGNETSEAKELERLAISTGDKFYDQIIEYRQINKMLTNDIPNWKPNDKTGAVHTEFGFLPATGQLNSRNPNVQNANKHKPLGKRFRRIIRARDYRDGRWAGRRRRIVEVDYCVTPDTLILTHEFEWKRADEIKLEESLIGFDEYCEGGKHRYLRESRVQEVRKLKKPCYRIITDLGVVKCSQDHRWLARGRNGGSLKWHESNDLLVGDKISYFTKPWEQDDSYEGSYLAGFFDGEGYMCGNTGVAFAQNPGMVLDYVCKTILEKGYELRSDGSGNKGCEKYAVVGGPFEGIRFIGAVRPIRLLDKLIENYPGTSVRGKLTKQATILKIEDIGEQEVIGIQTDTHTFIANGFLSHNSGFHAIMLAREAQSVRYLFLAQNDVHSWFASHIISRGISIPKDLSNIEDVKKFKEQTGRIKKENKVIRDTQAKPSILGIGLGLGPRKLYWMNRPKLDRKSGEWVGIRSEKDSRHYQGILKGELPELFEYQERQKDKAFRQTYLINKWGMIRWFFDVRGEDGEAAIAFDVQGNSHGMLRWVIRRLEEEEGCLYEGEDWDGKISALERFGFINTIHDSLVFEPWEDEVEICIKEVTRVMETPCMVLKDEKVCPQGLVVRVEASYGENWAEWDEKGNPGGMRVWKN